MMRWFLKRLPLALVLVVLWSILRISGVSFPIHRINGLILMCFCFGVIAVEFFKSGDISLRSFGWDLTFSVITTVIGTCTMTIIVVEKMGLSPTDFFMCSLIICDAWISPINSFRTAQRNWEAQIGTGPS